MNIKKIFKDCRIAGLVGEKNSGKTNNLISFIKELRQKGNNTPVYAYGLPLIVQKKVSNEYDIKEISSLKHLIKKKNCILIIDEFQRLKLNDRRYKDQLAEFIDFVYHNNVYVIFSSPNIREFNSVIGSVIDKWLLKTVRTDQCVNGSQLKKAIQEYKGRRKSMGCVVMPKDEILIINDNEEVVISCEYVEEADNKKENKKLF